MEHEDQNAHSQNAPVGIVLTSTISPGDISKQAKMVEKLGFHQLWVAEDPYFNGGFASAGLALAATESIPVGLGLVSVMVRHPVITAMEMATLADAYPNRFLAAIGLGSPTHLREIGLHPDSPLAAVRERLTIIRNLLEGGNASFETGTVKLNRRVDHPPPIYVGAIGPKILQLSGEMADGTILAVTTPPPYVTWARDQVNLHVARESRAQSKPLISFALLAIDLDGDRARQLVKRDLSLLLEWYGSFAVSGKSPMTDVLGATDLLIEMVKRGGAPVIESEMPASWLEDFVIAGDPVDCATKVRRYLDAGATAVMLAPVPTESMEEMIQLAGVELLPRLKLRS